MFLDPIKHVLRDFLNNFKNPCISRNLDKSDMNALKVNYIQIEKYSLFSCCQRFTQLSLEMPPKCVFREPKNAKEEKDHLDSRIPKATRYVTKWAYKIFGEWQSSKRNKNTNLEERGFEVKVHSNQSLETNIVDMSTESLNFWLTKIVAELRKENGKRYPLKRLYSICCRLQRHLENSNGSDAIKFLSKD